MSPVHTSAADLVARARARIDEIDSADALALPDDPEVVIVDIRDVRERQKTGWIPGSVHAPRGMLEFWIDPASPYHRPVFAQEGKRYVLHCASGWRSALAVAALTDMGWDCAHLSDGFTGWTAAGGAVDGAPDQDTPDQDT